jgi:pyrrolidone-carboxylate peptidase
MIALIVTLYGACSFPDVLCSAASGALVAAGRPIGINTRPKTETLVSELNKDNIPATVSNKAGNHLYNQFL